MIPDGIWYGVFAALIIVGIVVTIVASTHDNAARLPVFTLGSVAFSVGLLAAIGAGLEYIYLPG